VRLAPDPSDKTIIKKYQAVPHFEKGDTDLWTKTLTAALERIDA
jgi:hypothetical protein